MNNKLVEWEAFFDSQSVGLLQRSRGTKSAMLEGMLIIIPALEHQNKG